MAKKSKEVNDASNTFIKDILETIGNQYAGVVDDDTVGGTKITGYLDTGSYTLNALISGSLYGGIPENKFLGLAGEFQTGKTFILLQMIKSFLDKYPNTVVLAFDSESAITKDMLLNRKIDPKKVILLPVITVEEFRTQLMKFVNEYEKMDKNTRPKVLVTLDSLGQLSTLKEVTDIGSGVDKRDMTRAQLIRGAFRALQMKMGVLDIPLFMTCHTYQVQNSYVPTQELGGGSGLKYAASTIITLSKSKEKDEATKQVVGVNIRCKTYKSRWTKENQTVSFYLDYSQGLDRYSGLVDLALELGVFKKLSTKVELPDGTFVFESIIEKNPQKYFTKEILDAIDAKCNNHFKYSQLTVESATKELNDEAESV
jgi:RecA/RadA recombinase